MLELRSTISAHFHILESPLEGTPRITFIDLYIHSCTFSGFDDDFDEADMQLGASGGSAAAAAKP